MKNSQKIIIALAILVLSLAIFATAQTYVQQPVWDAYSQTWYYPRAQQPQWDAYSQTWYYPTVQQAPGQSNYTSFPNIPQTDAEWAAWQRQSDLEFQQFIQQNQQQWDQAYQQMQESFINYYRQNTGDYNTPDAQAMVLGDRLYCQNNPKQCQQSTQNHAQRMQDINAWGQQMLQNGKNHSDMMDKNHQIFLEYIRQ